MTRERVLTVFAALVVAVFLVLVASNTSWVEVRVPAPLRGEAATNPFYAAQRLAEALGASTARAGDIEGVPSDAVVVLSRYSWDVSPARRERFERWVEQGGRLVVDSSLIVGGDSFARWSNIERAEPPPPADDTAAEPVAAAPASRCAALAETIGTQSPRFPAGQRWLLCGIATQTYLLAGALPLWGLGDDEDLQVARMAIGRGSVTAINAEPFLYRDLLEADHGALFAAVTQLRRGDRVVFVSAEEASALPVLVWRHGSPVVVLLALALVLGLWRAGARFGPPLPAPESGRRSLAEQIRGTGRFTLRLGGGAALHGAARRALDEAAARRIPGYERLAPAERCAAIAAAAAVDGRALAAATESTFVRGSSELRAALALLESARRQLTSRSH